MVSNYQRNPMLEQLDAFQVSVAEELGYATVEIVVIQVWKFVQRFRLVKKNPLTPPQNKPAPKLVSDWAFLDKHPHEWSFRIR